MVRRMFYVFNVIKYLKNNILKIKCLSLKDQIEKYENGIVMKYFQDKIITKKEKMPSIGTIAYKRIVVYFIC